MGNREALIEGAKTCLMEKGYHRTTARDIATAAGVSLAAIGYHFGSKDDLMNEAMRAALDEWGAEVGTAMAAGLGADATARERFVETWRLAVGTLSTPSTRALWVTQFEVLSAGAPELLKELSNLQGEAREGVATLFGAVGPETPQDEVQLVGSFLQALLLGVVVQWLFDPAKAPSGEDLAKALELVSAGIQER
ncbi:TetR family transcriptional regulator [Kribbella voronezhensis]|uniref:TetR family transcriptional regulator n=1 Tax=Kribbella voronezhensis TaxID=2512212 RepID=A0A4R7TE30_9ACTN|nr:TetR/AcrR family transcriptional regulator [Kribbella voronezhensis]TDU90039.1 TetR family transcriptional regulator [Kribbella voronezhensis]